MCNGYPDYRSAWGSEPLEAGSSSRAHIHPRSAWSLIHLVAAVMEASGGRHSAIPMRSQLRSHPRSATIDAEFLPPASSQVVTVRGSGDGGLSACLRPGVLFCEQYAAAIARIVEIFLTARGCRIIHELGQA